MQKATRVTQPHSFLLTVVQLTYPDTERVNTRIALSYRSGLNTQEASSEFISSDQSSK